jgi:hypothetical protein
MAAVFYAVHLMSGIYRGRRDFLDSAYGGMAAGAILGQTGQRGAQEKKAKTAWIDVMLTSFTNIMF